MTNSYPVVAIQRDGQQLLTFFGRRCKKNRQSTGHESCSRPR